MRNFRAMARCMLPIMLGMAAAFAPFMAGDMRTAAQEVISVNRGAPTKSIRITRGKPQAIRSEAAFQEIVVGDPNIANVNPLTNRSFYILGNTLGTTRVALFNEAKQLVGSLDVEVTLDTEQLASTIRRSVPDANVTVSSANGRIMLSGSARDAVAAEKVEEIAARFTGEEEVVNSVKISSSQQVQLQVRFIEASREAQRKLGVQLGLITNDLPGGIADSFTLASSTGINLGEVIGTFITNGYGVDILIEAMENRGIARTLAEPNLVARSGETASFLAGGEFPIPVASDEGEVTIEFKDYGVGLEFTPTVLDDGQISLVIEPEVSQVDLSASYRIGDISIPGFSVRRARTSVDLRSGQSFVIAGLLQTENQMVSDKVPGLSNLPVLGALFSSREYRKRETDLIIIVTPQLVQPIAPHQQIATPLDGTVPATPAEFAFAGIEEVQVPTAAAGEAQRRIAAARNAAGAPARSGHILDLPGIRKGE